MGQPVTSNPLLIALINMTVVFGVLYGLSWVIRFINMIDPTRSRRQPAAAAELPDLSAALEPEIPQDSTDEEMLVLFTAAIAAAGYPNSRIVAIRPAAKSNWTEAARLEMITKYHRFY
ncbi:hypothetical protein P22_3434 [Propionispora sp. 2/2-37]|uniref:OadG family protein n=1 Tax=Propionispora sp. 2/2-37 TaxID=1677858 RepID=UPI0006BB93D3|nr:OadG family protein [Propionispora sp. 2/2-37]CUH97307.1 hypothetical protein P22_3434 [Propionispora sp. 2/2-37]